MYNKIIVHICTVLLLFAVCFSANINNTICYSYDVCMPSEKDVKKQELKDISKKNDLEKKVDENNHEKAKNESVEHVKCDPYYHYFWLFFWIITIGGVVILLYRLIKRKNIH